MQIAGKYTIERNLARCRPHRLVSLSDQLLERMTRRRAPQMTLAVIIVHHVGQALPEMSGLSNSDAGAAKAQCPCS